MALSLTGMAVAAPSSYADGADVSSEQTTRASGATYRINRQLASAIDYYRANVKQYQSMLYTPNFAEHPVRTAVNGMSETISFHDAVDSTDATADRYYTTYTYTLKPGRTLAVSVSNADDDDLESWRMFTLALHQSGVPADRADSLVIHDRIGGGRYWGTTRSFSGGFRWALGSRRQSAADWLKNGSGNVQYASVYNRICALLGAPQNVGGAGSVGTIKQWQDYEMLSAKNSTDVDQTITVSVLPGVLSRPGSRDGSWRVTFTERTFADVTWSTPHVDDIEWLAGSGISSGYEDGTFHGMTSVYRQDMAAFLYRLAGSPAFDVSRVGNPFSDVTPQTPHYKEILWLASTGISAGWDTPRGKEFRGMASVKRQDMAAFLHRLADYQKAAPALGTPVSFRDVTTKTPHAADIAWLARTGVTAGWPDGTYRGMNAVVRQDMAAFLHRMKTNVLK
ncbi:S-layer homology domain-containing protein [Bifidobacterium ramosum]|nr:S-layer homology domain-containing protein [Bifidobacterium ramosum]